MDVQNLQELNEALKNSFLAIKEDMNGLRAAIKKQDEHMAELAGQLALTVQNVDAKLLQKQRGQTQDAVETSELRTHVETQVEALHSQLLFLQEEIQTLQQQEKKDVKSIIAKEQEALKQVIDSTLDKVTQDADEIQKKVLIEVQRSREEVQDLKKQQLSPVVQLLENISQQVQHLDKQSAFILNQSQEQQDVASQVEVLKTLLEELQAKYIDLNRDVVQHKQQAKEERKHVLSADDFTKAEERIQRLEEELQEQRNTSQEEHGKAIQALQQTLTSNIQKQEADFLAFKDEIQSQLISLAQQEEIQHCKQLIKQSHTSAQERFVEMQQVIKKQIADFVEHQGLEIQTIGNEASLIKQELASMQKDVPNRLTTIAKRLEKNVEEKSKEQKKHIDTVTQKQRDHFEKKEKEISKVSSKQQKTLEQIEKQVEFLGKNTTKANKETKDLLSSQAKTLVTQQKMIRKFAQEITTLKTLSDKNRESSRRLNKLVKQFSQLRELSMPEDKGFVDSVKELFKREEPPRSLNDLNSTLSTNIHKLEVDKKKLSKEHEELGVIAKIGLEEGLISEKDL